MTTEPDNLVIRQLQAIREDLASFGKQLATNTQNVALIADGMLALRKEIYSCREGVNALRGDVQILTVSVGGHAERLADVEQRLGRIEQHLLINQH